MYSSRSLYDRLLEKTPEQIFINSLRSEFELSPAESKGVLDLAKSCLLREVPGSVGKIKYICASQNARHGRQGNQLARKCRWIRASFYKIDSIISYLLLPLSSGLKS